MRTILYTIKLHITIFHNVIFYTMKLFLYVLDFIGNIRHKNSSDAMHSVSWTQKRLIIQVKTLKIHSDWIPAFVLPYQTDLAFHFQHNTGIVIQFSNTPYTFWTAIWRYIKRRTYRAIKVLIKVSFSLANFQKKRYLIYKILKY